MYSEILGLGVASNQPFNSVMIKYPFKVFAIVWKINKSKKNYNNNIINKISLNKAKWNKIEGNSRKSSSTY